MTRASLLRRLAKLEEQSVKPDPVRVIITRRIVGKDGQTVQTIRRSFELYPEAHAQGRRSR